MGPRENSVFGQSLIAGWFLQILRSLPGLQSKLFQINTQRWGKWLLTLAVFSCVFIPRVSVGSIASSYQVDVRIEDFLLAALGIAAILSAVRGETSSVPAPAASVESAFLAFLAAAAFSILTGIYLGTVDKPFLT